MRHVRVVGRSEADRGGLVNRLEVVEQARVAAIRWRYQHPDAGVGQVVQVALNATGLLDECDRLEAEAARLKATLDAALRMMPDGLRDEFYAARARLVADATGGGQLFDG